MVVLLGCIGLQGVVGWEQGAACSAFGMAALGLVRCDWRTGGEGRLTTGKRPCRPASTCGRQGDNGEWGGGELPGLKLHHRQGFVGAAASWENSQRWKT